MENLESEKLVFATVGNFFTNLKQEFGNEDNETMKVAELKKVEQESKMIKEFVQKFRRFIRESEYEGRLVMEEFEWSD